MKNIIYYNSKILKNPSIVLIFAKFKNKWLLCKHKNRNTWEIPGGHIEFNENLETAAKRELFEESGAQAKELNLIGFCSIANQKERQHCAIFYATIKKFEKLPDYEIKEISLFDYFPQNTTYPKTYKKLLKCIGEK